MRLLDLFCGAGGASVGYSKAGFNEILGVDIEPQKRYPFEFIQADAFDMLIHLILSGEIDKFDLVHLSPRCQEWSRLNRALKKSYGDQITPLRLILIEAKVPYVIENVEGSPLLNPLMLCGTMFNLRVIRHRLFECNPPVWFAPASCHHWGKVNGGGRKFGSFDNGEFITMAGNGFKASDARIASNIDWMTRKELSQAIPPAYTEYIGKQIIPDLK